MSFRVLRNKTHPTMKKSSESDEEDDKDDNKYSKKINVSSEPKKRKKTRKTEPDEPKVKKMKKDELNLKAILEKFSTTSNTDCKEWTEIHYISEKHNINYSTSKNIVELFRGENTIPFIARYRKNITGGMEPDQLRLLKESYDKTKSIKRRAAFIISAIDKQGKWTPQIHTAVMSIKSLSDLEDFYSLFKTEKKTSLAERARKLGLGDICTNIIQGKPFGDLAKYVDPQIEGLKDIKLIRQGLIHILSDTIVKNELIYKLVRKLHENPGIIIETIKSSGKTSSTDEKKYEIYFNFKSMTTSIKPHQILAINRAEFQKIIQVKITLNEHLEHSFKRQCETTFQEAIDSSSFHKILINESIDYTYQKSIKPLIKRRVRSNMKSKAEIASIQVFATNLKQLLLTRPVRGEVILGIDPGHKHGCKLAVVSEHGNVLDTAIIYPQKDSKSANKILINLIKTYKIGLLALGNATGCRETEIFITNLIESKAFKPIDVTYTIVNEAGASIYSCGTEAKLEFPDLDPNIISAISIARRLQDPLAELVKVEPKHLGVGMYQHDLPEKQLSSTLDEVVSEAVSFVGVDVNTASCCLLRRVAGLNLSKANNIVNWRNKNGPIQNRKELLQVEGIGNKSYEQCAGFIRIIPQTCILKDKDDDHRNLKKKKQRSLNYFDQTWIHPESYEIAQRFVVDHCQLDPKFIGTTNFIDRVQQRTKIGYHRLAELFSTSVTNMEIIVQGLTMKIDQDIREKENLPVFRNSLRSIGDLTIGATLSGVVRNLTHFGAFVDVGVGRDGLIPVKFMKDHILAIGQRIETRVNTIDRPRNVFSLELIQIFT